VSHKRAAVDRVPQPATAGVPHQRITAGPPGALLTINQQRFIAETMGSQRCSPHLASPSLQAMVPLKCAAISQPQQQQQQQQQRHLQPSQIGGQESRHGMAVLASPPPPVIRPTALRMTPGWTAMPTPRGTQVLAGGQRTACMTS